MKAYDDLDAGEHKLAGINPKFGYTVRPQPVIRSFNCGMLSSCDPLSRGVAAVAIVLSELN